MIVIQDYDNFLLERYGYNNKAKEISDKIINLINSNIGKLIYKKEITLKSSLGKISNIDFIGDIINIKLSGRTYGNINPNSITNEVNSVYNLIMNLELMLSPYELMAKKLIDNEIVHTIEHESLHIIERYLTSINKKDFAKSWKRGEELQKLQNKYKSSYNWQDVSYLIYLSLPHEMRARLQGLSSKIKVMGLNGINDVQDFIKDTEIYKDVENLSLIDENMVIEKLKKDFEYNNIIKDFSLLFLKNENNNHEKNFLEYIENIKLKNKKLLEKLLKISYNFGSYSMPDIHIDYDKYLKK